MNQFWVGSLSRRGARLARILAIALALTAGTLAVAQAAEQGGTSGAVKAFVGEGWA
jgi:hypothetical protein